jgi:hypothetical protein
MSPRNRKQAAVLAAALGLDEDNQLVLEKINACVPKPAPFWSWVQDRLEEQSTRAGLILLGTVLLSKLVPADAANNILNGGLSILGAYLVGTKE